MAPGMTAAQRLNASRERHAPPPAQGMAPARTVMRPARVVAAWAALAGVVVAGSGLYLSFLVYVAAAGRTLSLLERQLEEERRRGERLEVALAAALSPEATERAARTLLAMEKPRQVQVVVVEPPADVPQEGYRVALARGEARGPGASARQGRADGLGAVARRLQTAMGDALDGSLALARRLPSWP